jgi:aspartyl aminopeptidase
MDAPASGAVGASSVFGIPVLSMHSARELCGTADPGYLAAASAALLAPAR